MKPVGPKKDFAQGLVGTANPWAKEGDAQGALRFVLNSIPPILFFCIGQQAVFAWAALRRPFRLIDGSAGQC